ncbi:Uncharacterised protein [Legionella pneumophila]|nr:Uncharacterised protein [Legionella pneumophila]
MHKVNSSRDPVRAICQSSLGKNRRPTRNISAMKVVTFISVRPRTIHSGLCIVTDELSPSQCDNGGINTSTITMARSSTKSQPTAIWPLIDSRVPLSSRALNSTTVLATERERPKIKALP